MALVDETILLVKLGGTLTQEPGASGPTAGRQVLAKLVARPELSGVTMIACVSEDVDIHDKESYIWGVFTRFDCERDVIFTETTLHGISPIYRGVMGIDATWKPGYPEPLVMPEEIRRRVDEKWGAIWKLH
jgi:4-hydroxy-3-polyprenylbenzoate decarboxylase